MTNAQNPAPKREFQAYAKDKAKAYGDNPRAAARAFFAANPNARKCNVIEGKTEYTDGIPFFVTRHGNRHGGGAPLSFQDVTKKTAETLPDNDPNATQTAAETFAQGVRDAGYKV